VVKGERDTVAGEHEEPTGDLIVRMRTGDAQAREILFRRYLPLLRRWAHGRLPVSARDMAQTDDLVQVTLMRALKAVDRFDSQSKGSFLAYLRQILLNEVRLEIRKSRRLPATSDLSEYIETIESTPSVLEQLLGPDRLFAYHQVLARMPRRQQEVLIMRLEFGMSYPEIAVELGTSPDAVRVMATRAAAVLAKRLGGANHE